MQKIAAFCLLMLIGLAESGWEDQIPHDPGDEELVCPAHYSKSGDRCYILKKESKTFAAAEEDCAQNPGGLSGEGHLASFHSAQQFLKVRRLFPGRKYEAWIGLTDENKNQWSYTDGYPFDYIPAYIGFGNWDTDRCAVLSMFAASGMMINDRKCSERYHFICEWTNKKYEPRKVCSQNKCYRLYNQKYMSLERKMNFTEAEAHCKKSATFKHSGHLASFRTEEEYKLLLELADVAGSPVWIGLNNSRPGNGLEWQSVSGSPIGFLPNKMNLNSIPYPSCAALYPNHPALRDDDCDDKKYWICEFSFPPPNSGCCSGSREGFAYKGLKLSRDDFCKQGASSSTIGNIGGCGTPKISKKRDINSLSRLPEYKTPHKRIVGGDETDDGELPWTVMITNTDPNPVKTRICVGSLISNKWVLTAAHCFNMFDDPCHYRVMIGNTQLLVAEGETKDWQHILKVVVHPEYGPAPPPGLGEVNDIALVKLFFPVDLPHRYTNYICLPSSDDEPDKDTCIAAGWGNTEATKNSRASDTLRHVTLPIVDREECKRLFERAGNASTVLQPDWLCLNSRSRSAPCKGDSGGPLVCKTTSSSDRYVQFGVLKTGPCGPGSIYTDVKYHMGWIKDVIRRNGLN